jgi:hypothetical protein
MIEFALALSEDPFVSRDKWEKLLQNNDILPLLAVFNQNIVGNIQAATVNGIGWLEHTRVSPDFRKKGIASTLVDAAMDWLISKGTERIRTLIDSDNLSARRIVERHRFKLKFLSINPTSRVKNGDGQPNHTNDFAAVLDEEVYPEFYEPIKRLFAGNAMIDGHYIPLTREVFVELINERRVYSTQDRSAMLILSDHNLPSEYYGFVIAKDRENYAMAGHALRGFASREMASIVVCHAPADRDAVIGLAKADYGWSQPHSLIMYERESWQERNESE